MGITIHKDIVQGDLEWLQARCGLLTASEVKLLITPTLKPASNDAERKHIYELAAQRITNHVEPMFQSFDMIRGQNDEAEARQRYAEHYGPVREVGFITNDKWGFTLGYSPDGLVGDDGAIECKSRKQKYQVQTVVEYALNGAIPAEFIMQLQTGMLVAELDWIDFVSFSEKLPMAVIRVHPDDKVQAAILEAAQAAEARIAHIIHTYQEHAQ
ncbi:YqaJ-like viral recombinase [Blastomonas sp. AAP25]|uniref:lambda exonuclease family protein n=1 Tax=Blastomonas sp. AAP25 TaxID=1523416 RepID=UPI0006B8DE0E|nr:lambda exonuclease family protein [Blastomonas sp. AAP25]KPF74540.1 YqaJ-like viral recombinase [Blastomonas sp. AAP25]